MSRRKILQCAEAATRRFSKYRPRAQHPSVRGGSEVAFTTLRAVSLGQVQDSAWRES